ncbi:hypothetical protein ES703_108422 [subsurface metagenome]
MSPCQSHIIIFISPCQSHIIIFISQRATHGSIFISPVECYDSWCGPQGDFHASLPIADHGRPGMVDMACCGCRWWWIFGPWSGVWVLCFFSQFCGSSPLPSLTSSRLFSQVVSLDFLDRRRSPAGENGPPSELVGAGNADPIANVGAERASERICGSLGPWRGRSFNLSDPGSF